MQNKKQLNKAIDEMYKGCEQLIIIGLTGRTGAGCSTVANVLKIKDIKDLDLRDNQSHNYSDVEERKNKIIYDYMKEEGKWIGFTTIEISSIILASVFELGLEAFVGYIEKVTSEETKKTINIGDKKKAINAIRQAHDMFTECSKFPLNNINLEDIIKSKSLIEYYNFYTIIIKEYKKRFKSILDGFTCYEINKDKFKGKQQSKYHLYTYLMQQMGNNIRCSGNPFNNIFAEEKYREFVNRIDLVVEIICRFNKNRDEKSRICIDAIRNPYESMYFKDKYQAFKLMAISTEDGSRKERLKDLNLEELQNLDKIEYPKKMKEAQEVFYHQNLQGCIENADIHIYNPNINNGKYYYLTEQIIKYISLMIHPGLVTPTHLERCMQLAYNAKLNSGCLSRQVGAVVTRDDYSVQSVGWNEVPKGQISCNLRDVSSYCKNKDPESYSKYEIEEKDFNKAIKKIESETAGKTFGRCMPYCFKDVYNAMKDEKNQVYTRALHAEENAFLQISKYGGTHVKDGNLFTTASPCELCAKKAYQLGIKNIYYIDPYPGISQSHILTFGKKDNPDMKLFYGAIGQAYLSFYMPRLPIKDEMEMLTGKKVKEIVGKEKKDDELKYEDILFKEMIIELKFMGDRNKIENTRTVKAIIKKENISKISKNLIWTGSAYDSTILVNETSDKDLNIKETNLILPYKYDILIGKPRKIGEKLNYQVITNVKDEKHVMEPYLAHMVKNDTKKLILRLITPKELIRKVVIKVYADLNMEAKISETEITNISTEENIEIYEFSRPNVIVNYTYAIEWDFIND
ncbi:MAG: dCMP deaminase [Lachnospiraceae bacterium]|nr:dCMP deaminase [Lachnospiraceae bacterium]